LATEAARAIVEEAFADESVTAVIAHTLGERNASNRAREKLGFRLHCEVEDEGERAWRFWRERGRAQAE